MNQEDKAAAQGPGELDRDPEEGPPRVGRRLVVEGSFSTQGAGFIVRGRQGWSYASLTRAPAEAWEPGYVEIEIILEGRTGVVLTNYQAEYLAELLTAAAKVAAQ